MNTANNELQHGPSLTDVVARRRWAWRSLAAQAVNGILFRCFRVFAMYFLTKFFGKLDLM